MATKAKTRKPQGGGQQYSSEYMKWFQIREEDYQNYLKRLGKDIKFDKAIHDLLVRFNEVHPQFLITSACSGYINKNGVLVSYMNPFWRVLNNPVGYGLVMSPSKEEKMAFRKLNDIFMGIADQVNFHFDDKVLEIEAEYPDGAYDMDTMKSEVIYSTRILKPEYGEEILYAIWKNFERVVDYFDLKGEKAEFCRKKFAAPKHVMILREKLSDVIPIELKSFKE